MLKPFTKANDKLRRTIDSKPAFTEFLCARDLGELQAVAKKKDGLNELQADLESFAKLVNPCLEEIQLETRLLVSTAETREEEKAKAAAAKADKTNKVPKKPRKSKAATAES